MGGTRKNLAQPGKTIIVVEDDPFNAEMLDLLLRQVGAYETLCFTNSHEALAHVNEIMAAHPLAFIFDYRLPYLNGLDLSRRLHEIQPLASVPTIILTAFKKNEIPVESRGLQRVTFVFKPYDIGDLLSTLQRMIAQASVSPAGLC